MLFNGFICKLSVIRISPCPAAPLSKLAQAELKSFCKVVQQRSGGSFKTVTSTTQEECLEGIRLQLVALLAAHDLNKYAKDLEFRANINRVEQGLAYEAFAIENGRFHGLTKSLLSSSSLADLSISV